jgi:thiosulfate/3-mercaptopyruvate sulfurtransferase
MTTMTATDGSTVAARNPALVDADWLEARLADASVRVIEVDVNAKAFDAGHIDGAVLWNAYTDLKRPDYLPVDDEALRELIERSGITPSTTVVFYGYSPSLAFWTMALHGHADTRILDLSRAVWHDEGRPWTTTPARVPPTNYPLPAPDARLRASSDDVLESIGSASTTILDMRTPDEYSGERFWPSGTPEPTGRAGHIPSAVNVDALALFDDRGRFASGPALEQLFADALPSGSQAITYCTIGNRASAAWFALTYLLGRDGVRVYDGSWVEWGHAASTPVAEGLQPTG